MAANLTFAEAWQDYRRRWRWFFGAWLGGFAVVTLLIALLDKLSLGTVGFWTLGPAWLVAFVVASIRLQRFKCPRCGRTFFQTFWYRNPFAQKCLHCGLPKWSTSEPQ